MSKNRTPEEFRSWLEGFIDAIEGTPTEEQWDRIKEELSKVTSPPKINWDPLPAVPPVQPFFDPHRPIGPGPQIPWTSPGTPDFPWPGPSITICQSENPS